MGIPFAFNFDQRFGIAHTGASAFLSLIVKFLRLTLFGTKRRNFLSALQFRSASSLTLM